MRPISINGNCLKKETAAFGLSSTVVIGCHVCENSVHSIKRIGENSQLSGSNPFDRTAHMKTPWCGGFGTSSRGKVWEKCKF